MRSIAIALSEGSMRESEILAWLRETDPGALDKLYRTADSIRCRSVGNSVHLRGLIEISNVCDRLCGYCGLRAANRRLTRYRMTAPEILQCAVQAQSLGYGTVVMQAGESEEAVPAVWMAGIVRTIKERTPLAVTLSLGERNVEDLVRWREAGADRYLLRFETSDPDLYARIHPPRCGIVSDRIALLKVLARLGYEVGSGIMVGIPGQTYESLARDLLLFRELDLDMIGVGPFIPHPATPLGSGRWPSDPAAGEQVLNSEEMVYKAVALTRLLCPNANIPSTTALATINALNGRELGLMRGANVVMPNLTPGAYRRYYEIYPDKACVAEEPGQCNGCLQTRIAAIGRAPGKGPGGRRREPVHV
jgi:biotin synthase